MPTKTADSRTLMRRRSLMKCTLNWLLAILALHMFMVMVMIELNGYCNADLIWERGVHLYALHLMHMVSLVKSMMRDNSEPRFKIHRIWYGG